MGSIKGKPHPRRYITYRGETRCMADWARVFGLQPSTLRKRMLHGETFEQAILPERPTNLTYHNTAEKKKCRTCRFRGAIKGENIIYCDYILHTGKRRGCPVDQCTRYEKGNPPKKRPAIVVGKGRRRGTF